MIDLSGRLPSRLVVDNVEYSIFTDYRVWLRVADTVKQADATLDDISFIFDGNAPVINTDEAAKELAEGIVEFLQNPNATPLQDGSSGPETIDYFLDGEYIYASFYQAYGIDLIDTDMHWHKFKALLVSLPDETKMARIMSYRSYSPSDDKKKYEQTRRELKTAWALPVDVEEKQSFLDRVNEMFEGW